MFVLSSVSSNVLLLLTLFALPHLSQTETVNADNGLYHDTGNGPCTRRVTVGGEADCLYSLKRLMSGTGVTNMTAKGLFLGNNGELVRYSDATADGEWLLESIPSLGVRVEKPSHRLHVQGQIRSAQSQNFVALDFRLQENVVASSTASLYTRVRALEVRDFTYKPAYSVDSGLDTATVHRSFTAQQVETTIPSAVTTTPGQEVFGVQGAAHPVVEIDALKVVDHQRLFAELTGAFQRLADLHDELRADHNQLRADFTALQQQVTARDAADLADRSDLRSLLSTESSTRLANATSLSNSIQKEENMRVADVQKLTRDLAYVSRVFTTYDGSGFGL
jgi:hypothetical protein